MAPRSPSPSPFRLERTHDRLYLDTIDVNPFIQPRQALFGTGLVLLQARSLVPFAGGIVLRQQGEVIGTLGVSGARTTRIDHEIAQSVLAEFEQV